MLSMPSASTDGSTDVVGVRLISISAVVLAEGGRFDASVLKSFSECLSGFCDEAETIIVANGIDDAGILSLKQTVADIPDCSCYVIADAIDSDAARILGMEAAVGDYMLLVNDRALEAVTPALPAVVRALKDGFEIVTALPGGAMNKHRPPALERLANAVLLKLSGLPIAQPVSDMVALSRDASLHILSRPNAALLLRARTAGRGFPATELSDAYQRVSDPTGGRSFDRRADTAIRLLVSIGAVPIRIVSLISLASSLLSILYAVYVVIIFFSKPNVASGWTTLSLQLSGMMFLFSVMLALLAEYIVQIYTATTVRRRPRVVRELRSEKTARDGRLNVIDQAGGYRFGAPPKKSP